MNAARPSPNHTSPALKSRTRTNPAALFALTMAATMLTHDKSHATDLAVWDFSGLAGASASASATTIDLAVQSASDITRGGGLTAGSSSDALSSTSWTTNNSPDADDYYEFSLTPAPGNLLNIDTLHLSEARSLTGAAGFEVRSNLDNYTTTLDAAVVLPDDSNNRDHSIPLGSAFDSISAPVTFRIYGYAAEASGGSWRLRNHSTKTGLVLEGTSIAATGALSIDITPATFLESTANPAASGTVSRTGDLSNPLTVTLSSSDTSEAVVSATVEIPADQSNASFDIIAIDDMTPDGDVSVTISATATGYTAGTMQVTIEDDGDLPPLVINEVDADTPGSDTMEFIELFNTSGEALSLDGMVVVLFNGDAIGDPSYRTIDLAGYIIPANGFFVIGNAGVSNLDITLPIGELRNGADAVAIYIASAASIPNGTLVSSVAGTLLDAVVYDTNDADDTDLITALTPGKPQVDEGSGASAEANSISRAPDGGAPFDTLRFVAQPPTPGTTNTPVTSGYSTWAEIHAYSEAADLDHDGDGLDNGTEYFMGSDPANFTSNPGMVAGTVIWPRAAGTTIGSFAVEVSTNLVSWEDATASYAANLNVSTSEVSFTPPSGAGRFFVRLSVTP